MWTHPKTTLPAVGTIMVDKRTDDFIVGIGDREGAGERLSGRHGLGHVS